MAVRERKSSVRQKARQELEVGLAGVRHRPPYTELGRWLAATEETFKSQIVFLIFSTETKCSSYPPPPLDIRPEISDNFLVVSGLR